jgi:membrane protein implicated in regulation of membrane protease activity
MLPLIAAGVVLVLGYNLELFGGALHTDLGFALAWGAFPVLVGYLAQGPRWSAAGVGALVLAALAATALSAAQRRLSTPARTLRRRVAEVVGEVRYTDGTVRPIDRNVLLNPLDGALKLLSAVAPTVAAAMLLYRWSAR